MPRLRFAVLASFLTLSLAIPAPAAAVTNRYYFNQRINAQGTYQVTHDFAWSNACQPQSGIPLRIRLTSRITYSGGNRISVDWVKVTFMNQDTQTTLAPNYLSVWGGGQDTYFRYQSGTVDPMTNKTLSYFDVDRAYLEVTMEERFSVGFIHPEFGCDIILFYTLYL